MKFISDYGNEVPFCSPQEVIAFRENRGSGNNFDPYKPLTSDIKAKLTSVRKVHGISREEDCLELMMRANHQLLYNYDFKKGSQVQFGPSVFPDHMRNHQDWIQEAIEYGILIMEAFGWVVTLSEDKDFYYLNFAPLLSLTPDEVERERDQAAYQMAVNALKVINPGLLKHKGSFALKELGMDTADFPLLSMSLKHLRILMPGWLVELESKVIYLYATS